MDRDVAHTTRRIELPEPYDAGRLCEFLAGRAIPRVELIEPLAHGWRYRRSLRLPHGPGIGEVLFTDGAATITAHLSDDADAGHAMRDLTRVLDLMNEPAAVDAALRDDPATGSLVQHRPGLRFPRAADRAEVAFRALVGQQVSVAAASTTSGFIAAEYGDPLPERLRSSGIDLLWPTASALADAEPATLRMPASKAAALRNLAAALRDGAVDLTAPGQLARTQLMALKGIGPWTAGYISIRACGDDDVLLDGDLIARRGAGVIGLPTNPRELRTAAQRYAPWRSYLTMHLWHAYAAAAST